MAAIGSSILPASALLLTPKVMNFTATLANTEYTLNLPLGTRKFSLQLRDNAILKIADTSGDIASGLYFSLFPGNTYTADGIAVSSGTISLFVEVSKPTQILEIFYWL